jgi:hypothetical protein
MELELIEDKVRRADTGATKIVTIVGTKMGFFAYRTETR